MFTDIVSDVHYFSLIFIKRHLLPLYSLHSFYSEGSKSMYKQVKGPKSMETS